MTLFTKKLIKICLLLLAVSLISFQSYARRLYYAEEFYLYVLKLYYTNQNLERNIRFMQWALKAPFDNPVRSLALIKTEEDFRRYKTLFRMRMNLLIIDSYLQLARRFDKEHVYFFNLWYAESLKESFTIARYNYEISLNYWEEARRYAGEAENIPGRISLEDWEEEQYLVQSGSLNYEKIIKEHLARLGQKQSAVENYLKAFALTEEAQ